MNQPTVPNLFHFYLTYLNLIPIDYLNRTKLPESVLLPGCWFIDRFIDSTIACLHVVGHNFMVYLPPEILKKRNYAWLWKQLNLCLADKKWAHDRHGYEVAAVNIAGMHTLSERRQCTVWLVMERKRAIEQTSGHVTKERLHMLSDKSCASRTHMLNMFVDLSDKGDLTA